MSIEISIIIPTKGREKILVNSLEYLLNSNPISIEIIVVNDGVEEIKNKINDARITYIKNTKSGAASARNCGAKIAKGEYLLFLDDDMLISYASIKIILEKTKLTNKTIFLPNWEYPIELLNQLQNYKFGRFLNFINYTSLKGWINNNNWKDQSIIQHNGIASYCLLLSRSEFEKTGTYNETIPFAGFEDYDLSRKLDKSGYSYYILTDITILHNEVDRILLKQWLERKRRGALTQRKAVEIGYQELILKFSKAKRIIFHVVRFFHPLIVILLLLLPNHKVFDPIYRFFVRILIGLAIFTGYSMDYEKN